MSDNMEAHPHRHRKILIIDDNDGDIMLMKEALNQSRFQSTISVANGGLEAISMLRARTDPTGAHLPHLIFLDLSLPRIDGYQVLRELKGDPTLRAIPVLVFTGSNSPSDIAKAYEYGANCYIVKPIGLDVLERTMRTVEEFWFGTAQLPEAQDAR